MTSSRRCKFQLRHGMSGKALAEFDEFADTYDAGMSNPLKRWVGHSAASYIDVKVRWLVRELCRQRCQSLTYDCRLLDFGCGDGLFLDRLRHFGFGSRLCGADVSAAMLEAASRRFAGVRPELFPIRDGRIDLPDCTFDVVIVSAVLHHVAPAARSAVYAEVDRLLAPGGSCFVFEHNPFHPLVQLVVRTTSIDRGARLLAPSDVRSSMKAQRWRRRTRWLMPLPPRWTWMRSMETLCLRLPIGAQYVVVGEKPPRLAP